MNKPLLGTGETPHIGLRPSVANNPFFVAVLWRVSGLENKIGRASDPQKRGAEEQRLEPRNTRNTRKDRWGWENEKTPTRKT